MTSLWEDPQSLLIPPTAAPAIGCTKTANEQQFQEKAKITSKIAALATQTHTQH
jgi:hypothetical protein